MDVAIVATARFPIAEPLAGGLEMHTYVLAAELAGRGHTVTVYAAGGSGPFTVEAMLPVDFAASAIARRDVVGASGDDALRAPLLPRCDAALGGVRA